jgi:hypothetical protein
MWADGRGVRASTGVVWPAVRCAGRRVLCGETQAGGVWTPTSSMSAVLAADSTTRSKLRGSTGPPSSVVNTRRDSVQWSPARSSSSFWVVRCLRSIVTTAGASRTVRRESSSGRPCSSVGSFRGQSGAAGIRRDEAPGLEAATLDGPPLWAWGLQRSGPSNGRDRGGVIIDMAGGKR